MAENSAQLSDARSSVGRLRDGLGFAIAESWAISRVRTTAMVVLPTIQGLLPAALALVVRELINEIVAAMDAGSDDRSRVAALVIASLLLTCLLAILGPFRLALTQVNTHAIEKSINLRILEHAEKLEYANFESPTFKDDLIHAIDQPGMHVEQTLTKCARSFSAMISVISLGVVLASIEPLLALYLVPVALPYLAHRWWISRVRYEMLTRRYRTRRWVNYYNGLLTNEGTLPEIRLLNLSPVFRRRIEDRLNTIFGEDKWLVRRELVGSIAFNVAAVAALHLALWQVVEAAFDQRVTVGDVAIFGSAAAALRTAVNEAVGSVGSLRWNLLNLRHLIQYFATAPAILTGTSPAVTNSSPVATRGNSVLEVKGVSFHYPTVETPVLNDVSFSIGEGETVALVGRNGSGKSTLVKLICGLYAPDSGAVTIDGIGPHGIARTDLQRLVSVVFQNFGDYEATAAESIAFGDWERLKEDREGVRSVAADVGVASIIESLPDGFDTQLGRSFGITSLSGGQKQSLAIARAATRPVPLMVLDEPTSNLDAKTEFEIFERFRAIARDQATLLIAHRFTTIELADRIVLLEGGVIAESGTHSELLAAGGEYARMYALQRRTGGDLKI